MNRDDIRRVLDESGVTPSRALGQNFLIDEEAARRIVAHLAIAPGDCVVEIGPGTGALTEYAAPLCRKLILVEFDTRLARYQKERWANAPHVEVHQADGATWDPRPLFAERPVKLLGNLPYSAGGAILQNFLSLPSPITRAVLMLQKEFIGRMTAAPGESAYGLLSLRIQKNWDIRALQTLPPEAFHPRPAIDSTVALLTPRDKSGEPTYDDRLLDALMRRGFSQRRKQLHKQMPAAPLWADVAARLKIPPAARAEELSLPQWIELARAYDSHPLAQIPQKDDELFDVVDAEDRVFGQAARREVHIRGLMHRAVHILVFNKHRDCLLQKRSRLKDRHPGVWDSSAAGHVDAGEDYETAARRELEEELGIRPERLIRIAKLSPCPENGWEHVVLYAAFHAEGAISFPASEIETVTPFPPSVITRWLARSPEDFAGSFPPCWEAASPLIFRGEPQRDTPSEGRE